MRLMILVPALAAVLISACGDSELEPTRTAVTSAPPEATQPPPAGDLLIYTHQVREESGSGRSFPVLEVVSYDLAARRRVSAFEVGGVDAYPLQVVLAGNRIIANMETRIAAYNFDGNETVIAEAGDGHFIGVGASADGSMVAYTEQTGAELFPYEANTRVVVKRLDDGSDVLTLPQSDPGFADYRGQIAIPTWRADGRGVVLSGYTYSEAPGGLATVLLDGTVTPHNFDGYAFLAPTGNRVADDDAQLCDLGSPPENHEVRIVGLDSGATTATLRDDALTLQSREWSPDGSELLVERYALRDVPGMTCKQREPASDWLILPADGSDSIALGNPEDARDRWYEHELRYTCEGQPAFEPYCSGANGLIAPLTVAVDGATISQVENFTLVGFVDAADR